MMLACRARATSDIVIERPSDARAPASVATLRDLTATVIGLEDIARDIRRVVLDVDGPHLEFHAGQYAEIAIPGTGLTRRYSMANPPGLNSRLEFHVRRIQGGIATQDWIFGRLRIGDTVELRAPFGEFFLDSAKPEAAILIGGGTGLAPLKAIALQALRENLLPRVFLYHGGRTQDDLYDRELFDELSHDDRFEYVPVLSEQDWDGATGMVTEAVAADFPSCRGMRGYLCGPPAMVSAGVKALKRRRMSPRMINREEFVPALGEPSKS